ncbi:MAG TPA: TonB-dependent receptor plug domain-containing protein, partial [Chitinophagaceae bacterium]|nr:TonB-dependent receptor plug domain-containing protein [Chitinophagaceae bacterium]
MQRCIKYITGILLAGASIKAVAQETTDTIKAKILEGVTIKASSATQQVKQQAVTAAVVNAREAYGQPATLTELINRSPGVRLRQSGGLGAATDVSVNGFQGKAIRYVKDGIPLDYLRDGFNIASLPVNMLERVEVYKGVLPVALGVDALGGVVNLVSRRTQPRYLAASYEIASFNTHRITLNGYYSDAAKKWFAGVEA